MTHVRLRQRICERLTFEWWASRRLHSSTRRGGQACPEDGFVSTVWWWSRYLDLEILVFFKKICNGTAGCPVSVPFDPPSRSDVAEEMLWGPRPGSFSDIVRGVGDGNPAAAAEKAGMAVRRRQRLRGRGVGVDRDLFGGGDGAGAGEENSAAKARGKHWRGVGDSAPRKTARAAASRRICDGDARELNSSSRWAPDSSSSSPCPTCSVFSPRTFA